MKNLAKVKTLSPFPSPLTSQKEIGTTPGIQCTQGEAGEDHCCTHKGSGEDAVKEKTIRLRATETQSIFRWYICKDRDIKT